MNKENEILASCILKREETSTGFALNSRVRVCKPLIGLTGLSEKEIKELFKPVAEGFKNFSDAIGEAVEENKKDRYTLLDKNDPEQAFMALLMKCMEHMDGLESERMAKEEGEPLC